MEDLFEMMMESQQLRGRRRKKKSSSREERLEADLLREALGGSGLGGSANRDSAWLDLDNALAAKGRSSPAEEFEANWSGEEETAPTSEETTREIDFDM